MKDRVKVLGNIAILKVITGRPGDADTGLILHGADQCFLLAEVLINAGECIKENERRLSFEDIRARLNSTNDADNSPKK
jgi:hypothetical protein